MSLKFQHGATLVDPPLFHPQVIDLSRCEGQLQSGVPCGLPLHLTLFFWCPSLMKGRKEGRLSRYDRRCAAGIARASGWHLSDPQRKCRLFSITAEFLASLSSRQRLSTAQYISWGDSAEFTISIRTGEMSPTQSRPQVRRRL
jgi:hypothetical protein